MRPQNLRSMANLQYDWSMITQMLLLMLFLVTPFKTDCYNHLFLQYKVLCRTKKSLKTGHTSYHCSILSFITQRSTCSSSLMTLNPPYVTSGLNISNRSFYHFVPILWKNLLSHLRNVAQHSTSSSLTSVFCESYSWPLNIYTSTFFTSFAIPLKVKSGVVRQFYWHRFENLSLCLCLSVCLSASG